MTASRPPHHHARLRVLIPVGIALVLIAVGLAITSSDDPKDAVATRGSSTSAPATSGSAGGSSTGGTPSPSGASTSSGGSAASTSTSAPKRSNRRQPKAITLLFAGDLLPHGPLVRQAKAYAGSSGKAYDFDPMFAPVKPVISAADVAICHMETPVAPTPDRITGYPSFGAPGELVDDAHDAGYDGCSNASNHSLDQGRDGIAATLDRFDRNGMRHAGMARTQEESTTTTFYDVKGVKVAHLSYSYGFNGYPIPSSAPWAVKQIDAAAIKAAATKARGEGADLVVVSLHWGTQYQHDPDQYQRDVAASLLPSPDIDLIVGAHAHVVQPITQVAGTYVIWGVGNQLANQPEVPRSDGLTALATARRGKDGRWQVAGIEAIPTWNEPNTFRVFPVVRTLADRGTPAGLRSQLVASYDRSAAVLVPPKTPGVTLAPKP